MASTVASGAALVIKRMFEDPIPRLLPSRTSLSQLLEDQRMIWTYSPEKWADPLLVFKWKLGEEEDIAEVMPATEVVLTSMRWNSLELQPNFSAFGLKLKAMLKSDQQYDQEEWDYIISKPEWSMAQILHSATIPSNSKDEAAIVRLLLLQIMLSKPKYLASASSLVHQIAVNMSVKEDKCTGSWSPPPEISQRGQIGTETSTSALYVLTIDEYNDINYTTFKDNSLNDVSPSSVVYIPVLCGYSGSSWLMAYILSFTSTSWWNHAYTLDVEYTNAMEEATPGLPMKATFMPKAATVHIPGNYSYICLVVIDATRAEFPDDWQFDVCKGITASRAGNFEFAKKAYAYLGRLSDPDVAAMSCDDIYFALQEMAYMFSDVEFRQLQLKASILATSRFNGFGCYPNPEPPKNRKHIFGPAAFNNKNEIQIGDYVVPDLGKMEEEERRTRLHVLNLWRCDPLGYFTHSTVDLHKDGSTVIGSRYKLCVSTNDARVLRACGVFARDSNPGRHIGRHSADIWDISSGYASLMLGLTNWALVEMGCTLFEHNGVPHDEIGMCRPDFHGPWNKLTSGFVIDPAWGSRPAIIIDANQRKVGWIMNISEQEDSVDADWTGTHYSGNVPWWFVGAIAEKFGHSFKIEAPANRIFMIENEKEIGWYINGEKVGNMI